MKLKPSPELNIAITAITFLLALSVVHFGAEGYVKWILALSIILGGVIVEHYIERAHRSNSDTNKDDQD